MTHRVVDGLEAIDVDEQQPARPAGAGELLGRGCANRVRRLTSPVSSSWLASNSRRAARSTLVGDVVDLDEGHGTARRRRAAACGSADPTPRCRRRARIDGRRDGTASAGRGESHRRDGSPRSVPTSSAIGSTEEPCEGIVGGEDAVGPVTHGHADRRCLIGRARPAEDLDERAHQVGVGARRRGAVHGHVIGRDRPLLRERDLGVGCRRPQVP